MNTGKKRVEMGCFQKRRELAQVRSGWPRYGQDRKSFWMNQLAAVISVGILVGLSACAGPAPTTEAEPLAEPRGGALVASVRSEPRTFNRLIARDTASSLIAELTQAALVRINKVEGRIEPWLAESWTRGDDGRTYTLRLREGLRFSDGSPFTAADVLFSFEAVYDDSIASPLGDALRIDGKPIEVTALDRSTVIVRFPKSFSPGVRVLSNLPILPRHRLGTALAAGTLAEQWDVTTPPDSIVGLGPFVLSSYLPGQRLVFARNPHYWRQDAQGRRLPYLDRLTLEIVPDQNAEMLRLESGQIDFTQTEVRATDYASLRRAEAEGWVQLFALGVALDADFLFFNLRPEALAGDLRRSWLQADDFRRAISHAVDRRSFADTVCLGLGEPVYGPVTPGHRRWHNPDVTNFEFDVAQARTRLAGLGLGDRDGDGMLEDRRGEPVRFTLLTQRGHTVRETAAAVLAEDLRQVGIAVDVVPLEFGALIQRVMAMDFDAAYLGFRASDTDPASNLDLWLSSAAFHFWNPSQPTPSTAWEAHIDEVMAAQISAPTDVERERLFDEVQQIFAEFVPAIYFAAPRVFVATSSRVANADPALLEPFMLWNADTLAQRPSLAVTSDN